MSITIASWNINSVRFRIDIVERFLAETGVDILCLQETKVMDDAFPHAAFEAMGYRHRLLHGQRMHHGVAILSRIPLAEARRNDWQDNGEARHIGARLPNGLLIENVYVPAGGDIPDRLLNPKFGQKLDFLGRMTDWSAALREPTLIVGDFNIAPLECDVWSHKALLDVVSHTPLEVETLERFQASHGWVDLGRRFIAPPERLYTWWSYRAADWKASDRGRRLDHIWASPDLAPAAKAFLVLEDARNWGKPSDHIPQIVTLDL
ncbi:exodeoxyribonuclease III [Polymorphobacter multimanifer]|uniref:Exodeoxyribonuclease-3 n=1 Tax=Polymorphobacter multimanifer TaxID=1070431 RepID=A0A841L0U6_9SPHN|nr:exodeoxyribonuclease III [Polymorphobacter multimanifer]MBB6226174.1 exodeoxyribonuclease-3 [Polymorphobacter multimanifer]GGI71675.1 exodeoxyribonuclease III [Polymorphobacter multimanifer]